MLRSAGTACSCTRLGKMFFPSLFALLAMAYYAVRSAPYNNRPWSGYGKDADEGIAEESQGYSNRKSLDSLERSRRIKKRQEEWKQVLNSAKEEEPKAVSLRQASLNQPPLRDRKHLLVNRHRVSCSDIKDRRPAKTAETLSLRDLRDRRRRGELVQAAKSAINVQESETINLQELREQKRLQRQRDLEARRKAENSRRLSTLEQEMSPPVPTKKTLEPRKPPPLAVRKRQPAPRRLQKLRETKERSTEMDWFDKLLIKVFAISCCAGREVVPETP